MQNMQTKPNRLHAVTHAVVATSKQFFELPAATQVMPAAQLTQFVNQALAKQYLVTLHFQDGTTLSGRIVRPIGERFLIQAYHSNLVRVFALAELRYINRVAA